MNKLSDILPKTIKQLGIQKKYSAQSIIVHWKEIVGVEIAAHTYAKAVYQGVLTIAVTNSVWCHHLSMMKVNLITKINTFLGEAMVKDIRFQAGFLKSCQHEGNDGEVPDIPRYNLNKVPLNDDEVQRMQEMLENVNDKYLRRKIYKIMRKDTALKKLKKQSSWHKCAGCSVLCSPEDRFCTACSIKYKEEIISRIIDTLKDIPWLNYRDMNEHVACRQEEYQRAKDLLINSIVSDIRHSNGTDKLKAMTFIMLTTGAKIEALNDAIISKTLEKFRGKQHVFTSRI